VPPSEDFNITEEEIVSFHSQHPDMAERREQLRRTLMAKFQNLVEKKEWKAKPRMMMMENISSFSCKAAES